MSPLNVPAAHGEGVVVAASQVWPIGHGRQSYTDVTPVAPCRATSGPLQHNNTRQHYG